MSKLYVVGTGSWGGVRARARVERRLADFRDGMPVRYDPDRPEEAALLPFPAWAVWVAAVGGALALLCGAAALL